MFRINQRTADIRRGDGPTIFLGDRSRSMSSYAIGAMDDEMERLRQEIPGLRAFGFHYGLEEAGRMLQTQPGGGDSKSGSEYVNRTYMGAALQRLAGLNPKKMIIVSDGGVGDQELALRVVEGMTGEIDAYWSPACNHEWQDRSFMQKLARKGRGRFVELHYHTPLRAELRKSLTICLQPVVTVRHMAPEHRIDGMAVRQSVGTAGAKIRVS
jgi:hypothetical protein